MTIGANHNALVFYDRENNRPIDLNDRGNLVRLMDRNDKQSNTPKNMSALTGLLNLSDSANEAEIASAVRTVIGDRDRLKAENATLTSAIDQLNQEKAASRKAEAVALVDAAIKDGRLDARGRDGVLALFDKDFDGAKGMLESIPRRSSVTGQIHRAADMAMADLEGKSWDELDKAGKLLELKDSCPDVYAKKLRNDSAWSRTDKDSIH